MMRDLRLSCKMLPAMQALSTTALLMAKRLQIYLPQTKLYKLPVAMHRIMRLAPIP